MPGSGKGSGELRGWGKGNCIRFSRGGGRAATHVVIIADWGDGTDRVGNLWERGRGNFRRGGVQERRSLYGVDGVGVLGRMGGGGSLLGSVREG